MDPRRAAGARPRGGKHRRPGASSLPVPLHLPLQAGHEPAGADLGSRSVDVAQRSRSPARLRESAGGHESSVRAAAPGPERSADAQGSRGADAGPARPLHGRRAEHTKSHAAGWRRGPQVRIIRSGSRILSPPDTSPPSEYASDSSQSRKLLCAKHGFASVVVVGTSGSTKSLVFSWGHNSDYQLWNFVGRSRATVKILDSRCGLAENGSMVRRRWTEGPAKHKEAPLTPCDSVFFGFSFSGNFHFTSLDQQSRTAPLQFL